MTDRISRLHTVISGVWAPGVLLLVPAVLAALCGCTRKPEPPASVQTVTLEVFAPWSMEKRLRRVFEMFQTTHPGVTFRLTTGTPGKLVGLMKGGERADVYVSMGPVGLKVLSDIGLLREGTDVEILRQRLILICTDEMKAHVKGLRDLAKPQVRRVALGGAALSAGVFSRAALDKLGILETVEAKSQKSPLHSLLKGEVDATIILEECCYYEDLQAGRLVPRKGINVVCVLDESLCPAFPVMAVALRGQAPPDVAGAFVQFLTTTEAQDILRRRVPGTNPVSNDGN